VHNSFVRSWIEHTEAYADGSPTGGSFSSPKAHHLAGLHPGCCALCCILVGAENLFRYADGGLQQPEFGAKFILVWAGLDRCRTIGFRCVVDL